MEQDDLSPVIQFSYCFSESLEKILLDTLDREINFPIIKSNYFGHTERKTVIPIGTKAKIDTSKKRKISITEKCVNGVIVK